ncbi:MAG: NERD domain-containing protein [Anaerolineae bacterium]|nr:NERD domain-containing protein [Anaerolineae bacterium]
MRLTRNEKLIQQRSTWARYLTFIGMGLLLISLITSFTTDYIAAAYGTLLGGFVVAMAGSYLAHKWLRPPRADLALEKALKGFDNKHHLYNYLLPAEHVLVAPSGVWVFKTKYHDDDIVCKNGKWNRPWKWSRLFGAWAQESLGDPIAELQEDIQKIRRLLAAKMNNPVPVDGYVVFTHPRARLSIDDPNLPVVMVDDLKDTLRKRKSTTVLPPPVLSQIETIFDEYANAKTAK